MIMMLPSVWFCLGVAVCLLGFISKSNSQSPGDVRLVNSSIANEGRVEVYYNGTWGTICDNSWDIRDGNVICRQLGYPGARAVYTYAYFGRGTGRIWLTYMYCSGLEANITSCSKSPWGGYRGSYYYYRYCTHRRDAGVACHNKTAPGSDTGGSCTFETGSHMCGYTNAQGNQVQWRLKRARDYSYYYAPYVDHTFGNGVYIHLQTRYYYYRINSMASLISPQITGGKCIRFYHHMKGSHLAQLNVFIKSTRVNKTVMLWQQVGGQYSRNNWMKVMVPVEGFTTYKIIFEAGIPGSGYGYGSISLDDIYILNDTCKLDNSGNCTFDMGHLCGYTNAKDDDFDWSLHTGRTSSYYSTGPQRDHTTGKGNYLYIRTSTLNGAAGQIARLVSPEIYDTRCVEFYYHMKGSEIGELNVFIDDGVSKKMVWELIGEQSSNWSRAAVPVKAGLTAFRIIFEGVSGGGYSGNIAIDDITIYPTTCAVFPAIASQALLDIRNITHNVRLVSNVSSAGRLEVFHNGRWGSVCGSGFPLTSARVVCKELGFLDAEVVVHCCSIFPSGKGRILLDNVKCRGDEPSISMCSHRGWGISRCSHSQDVGVICRTRNTLHNVRMIGSSNDYEGRVEVEIGGLWGTVSDGGWDIWDVDVFCRQIGFAGASAVFNAARFGRGSGPMWIEQTGCSGHESALWECNVTLNRYPQIYPWMHRRDAGAQCYDLRLMGGRNDSQGIVEIRYLGIWGTICNDGWDMKDAQVVCRQLGYYKAASLILGYSAIPSNGTEPLITKLECTGNEPSIGLCNKQVLLAVSHHCDHTKDAQVVCAHPMPTTSSKPVPTERGVNEFIFTKLRKSMFLPFVFKKSMADQLNDYCRSRPCGMQSQKFKPSDIVIMKNYPRLYQGNFMIRFKVFYPGSNQLFPNQTIYDMAKEQRNIAGYAIMLPHSTPSPQTGKRSSSTGLSQKMKIVLITGVVVVFIAAVLIAVFIYRKKKTTLASVRYRVQSMTPPVDNNDDDVYDDSLLALNHDDDDQTPLLT